MTEVIWMIRLSEPPRIGGTLVWYYAICSRQVWLMGHGVEPDREDEFLMMGRLIDQNTYRRERHSIEMGSSKFDILREEGGTLIVGEVKKSSRSIKAARLQLAHYLYELEKRGMVARGELLFPREKKRESVELTGELRKDLDRVYREIERIVRIKEPPEAAKCRYCRNCAYKEFCWS